MKLHTLLRLACLVALFSIAAYASAQPAVKCESNNGGRVYCGAYTPNQVTMNKQISGAPCVRGSTWGVDNRGLWVDKGCRATFYISGNRQPGPPPLPPGPGQGGGSWYHPRPAETMASQRQLERRQLGTWRSLLL